ncbi:MAG: hypothetical protein M3P33_02425 [bacterium]|nr:hypothetical protein [bacterium]
MKKLKFGFLVTFWLSTLILIVIFSYTQVDLNLTFLNWQPYLDIQKQLTQLGYFNRPSNYLIFIFISIALTVQYLNFSYIASKNLLSQKNILLLTTSTAFTLLFSYNAFSHDFFNYMFDARIVTKYSQNPYFYKALDFPLDTWTRYMHWTHRNYPYGPIWLAITVIPSFLGFGKFLVTFFLFKLMFAGSYLISCNYLYKTLQLIQPQKAKLGLILFSLCPVILIDGLVSPHLDLVMLSLFSISLFHYLAYFIDSKKTSDKKLAFTYLFLSVLVKFSTILALPLYFLNPQKTGLKRWLGLLAISSVLGAVIQSYQGHINSWYWIISIYCICMLHLEYKTYKIAISLLILSLLMYISYGIFIQTGIGVGFFEFKV